MPNRRFHRLFHHRSHALGHAQADIVGNREPRPQYWFQVFKALQKLLERRSAKSNINPYGQMGPQTSGILLGGIEIRDQDLLRSKTRNPALDLARGNKFPPIPEQASLNLPGGRRTPG